MADLAVTFIFGVCKLKKTESLFQRPYRDDKAPLLEVLHQRNGVLLEVGQAAVGGLGVVVGSALLLGSLLQPLLQPVVGAGQEHHQVRGADLKGRNRGETLPPHQST